MKREAVELIMIGIIARNMGHADQSAVCQSGRDILDFVLKMTYKDFSAIKKHAKNESKLTRTVDSRTV